MAEIETRVTEHLEKALREVKGLQERLDEMETNKNHYQEAFWNLETKRLKGKIKSRIHSAMISAAEEINQADNVPEDSLIIKAVLFAMNILQNPS